MKSTNTKAVKTINCKVVLSDKSAKKIGLSSVGEIKKGALITLPCYPEGTQNYRILDVNGTQIKVIAMHSIDSIPFDQSGKTVRFDNGNLGLKYKHSNLDTKMDAIWTDLPANVKKAIVPQVISQSMYKYQHKDEIDTNAAIQYFADFNNVPDDSAKRGLLRTAETDIGERYVFALDIDDIIEYFGGGFNCQQLNELFFNTKSSVYEVLWLRSAGAGNSASARLVNGNCGTVNNSDATNDFGVRPAFVLDLAEFNF